jgi:hypothetical protein
MKAVERMLSTTITVDGVTLTRRAIDVASLPYSESFLADLKQERAAPMTEAFPKGGPLWATPARVARDIERVRRRFCARTRIEDRPHG